ncbi:MAG: zinc-binding dehydrogenase [Candidatus Latescibacterota bacterium]|nr:MAG: zinc-binding dehydrogenase [Candidatus Latescibacterota bacterium]
MVPEKMMAAVLHGPKELKIEDVDTPRPGAGDVLVEVAANGLCHTDVTYYEAKIPEKARMYPLILGHEAAGTVVALGDGAAGLAEGDHVLLPPVYGCGECDYCQAGLDNLCRKSVFLGASRHGTYAQYVTIPAKFAFKMAPSVDMERACVAADSVSTVYYALKERVGVRPGDSVAVFGCGGLGLAALNVARELGAAKLYAVDVRDDSLEAAARLGAETVNSKGKEKLFKELKTLSNAGIRIALDCVGFAATISEAFATVCKGGEVGVIGFTLDKVELRTGNFMGLQKRIGGSWACPTRLYPEVVTMIEKGGLDFDVLVSKFYDLEQVETAFADLEAGKIVGRAVIRIPH